MKNMALCLEMNNKWNEDLPINGSNIKKTNWIETFVTILPIQQIQ